MCIKIFAYKANFFGKLYIDNFTTFLVCVDDYKGKEGCNISKSLLHLHLLKNACNNVQAFILFVSPYFVWKSHEYDKVILILFILM